MQRATSPTSAHNWRGLALIAIVTLSMLAWSWRTWSDPLVDFGTQLYVPWQMTEGKVLYRDLAYYNGPLSQYVNAALFELFGVSLRTLVMANLCVVGAVIVMIYRLARRASGRLPAVSCCVSFVLLFAFGQGVGVANFNWVTPYTTEITHGIALGLLAIILLDRYQRTRARGWLAAAGAVFGLAFLTKAEPFVAALMATGAIIVADARIARRPIRDIAADAGIVLAVAFATVLIALLLMSLQMPLAVAACGVAGSWPWVFDQRVTALPFYREIAGTDDLRGNLVIILQWTTAYAALLGIALLLAFKIKSGRRSVAVIVFVIGVTLMCIVSQTCRIDWNSIIRPLPVCLFAALTAATIPILRRTGIARVSTLQQPTTPGSEVLPRAGPDALPSDSWDYLIDRLVVLRFGLVVFAVAMLAKISLNAHVFHYGFALAMPGVLVLVAVLAEELPRAVQARGGNSNIIRAIGAVGWGAVVFVTLYMDHLFFAQKVATLGTGGDAMLSNGRGAEVQTIVDQIRQLTPADSTLVVLPQGLMVNYLARRADPIAYLNFMPPEVLAAGEDRILAALAAHLPDEILVNTSVVERDAFTLDSTYWYGRKTLDWVRKNYVPAQLPTAGPLFRFVLLTRSEGRTVANPGRGRQIVLRDEPLSN